MFNHEPVGFTRPASRRLGLDHQRLGWLCSTCGHWLFTHDKKFLRWAYPIMKGSALCYLDMLGNPRITGWSWRPPTHGDHF